MDIPIRFKIYLFWKNLFSKKNDSPHIKITKEGKGVRSVLFFLPEKKEDAKVINYFVKIAIYRLIAGLHHHENMKILKIEDF